MKIYTNLSKRVMRTMIIMHFILAVSIVGFCVRDSLAEKHSRQREQIIYDEDAHAANTASFADKITLPCWNEMFFAANTTNQKVNFYNPANNKGINLKISLFVEDAKIYESKFIEAGKSIYDIKINNPLPPQKTPAFILYECYSDDGIKLNGSKMNFTLVIGD